jgi:hypothetical protein
MMIRRRLVPAAFAILASAALLPATACSGGTIAVGKTDQSTEALQKKTDGSPTGNGQSCSWDGTSVAATYPDATAKTGPYVVGQSFKSPDGCNTCNCSAQGIMCTVLACAPPPRDGDAGLVACPALAKVCPDGSSVGPTGPNCEFPECPPPKECIPNPMECAQGYHVVYTPQPPNCPVGQCVPDCDGGACSKVCPAIAELCPDGSSVSPQGPACTIPACPAECAAGSCGAPPPIAAFPCPGEATTLYAEVHCVKKDNGTCGWGPPVCLPLPNPG